MSAGKGKIKKLVDLLIRVLRLFLKGASVGTPHSSATSTSVAKKIEKIQEEMSDI
jgi:hypothetical protein